MNKNRQARRQGVGHPPASVGISKVVALYTERSQTGPGTDLVMWEAPGVRSKPEGSVEEVVAVAT